LATRILIVDDNRLVRQSLARLLCSHQGWEVCGEASDGDDGVRLAKELNPDLVVMDFLMPRMNGIEAGRAIAKLFPLTPILLCTVSLSPQLVKLARGAGISGTLSKGSLNIMPTCIEGLLRGETCFRAS
jgi:DNA-binding NarL/FixJ family response regulator